MRVKASERSEDVNGPVIVGFDASENARDALVLGRLLAKTLATRLLAITAYSTVEGEMLGTAPRMDGDERARLADRAAELMEGLADAEHRAVAVPSAAAALHLAAKDESAQVIVVGSSRRAVLGRIRVGGGAAEVLDHAHCAVAIAATGLRSAAGLSLARIGLGFDDSPSAHEALHVATRLASGARAELSLIWAAELDAPSPVAVGVDTGAESVERRRGERAEDLSRVAAGLGEDVRVGTEVVPGKPVDALVQASAEFDLLVLGSRGHGPLRRAVLGSVSREVVAKARCSVLVVPNSAGAPEP
jgi:nucleotide-binding universal stress UspA family protein